MDTVKRLWSDLYENKPLFFAVIAVLIVLLYLFWKNIQANNAATQPAPQVLSDGTTASGGTPATTPVDMITNYIMNITNPTPVTQSTGNPPPAAVPQPAKTTPTIAKASGTPQPTVARTVTVSSWPSQNSTLWGIAQAQYGNGNQWPKIYQANKSQIKDPNLIYAGQKLVIP